jgi:probable rRNA maturation factor
VKERVLGTRYELSLVFIGAARSQTLNRTYRHKDYPTNVLAFPLHEQAGEIFINVDRVRTEARTFGRTPSEHACALFIHACLHLKGHRHGSRMENTEARLIKAFLA